MDQNDGLNLKTPEKKKNTGLFVFTVFAILFFLFLAGLNIYLLKDSEWDAVFNPEFDTEGDYYNQFPGYNMEEVFDGIKGRIPILEYHIIKTPAWEKKLFSKGRIRKDKWIERFIVSSDELRGHLERLYEAGFRNISLDEYLSLQKGQFKALDRIPPDSKLYILTFDDATYGQFDITGLDDKGNPIVDPDCAVGIMMEFAKIHPDFKLNAAFSITFEHAPFMQGSFIKRKLNMLMDMGFEIVNHTKNHRKLTQYVKSDPDIAAYEIGRAMELFESYLGYRASAIDKICYPDGKANADVWKFVQNVTYNGRTYHFRAALDAEGLQAKNPNETNFNVYNIARIETSSRTFETYILNAKNIYRTPDLKEKVRPDNENLAFYQPVTVKKDVKKDPKKTKRHSF